MIGDVLFDAAAIARRVNELGAEISRDYAGRLPLLLGVLDGAATFLADLTRAVSIPIEYDVIAVTKFSDRAGISIYKDTTASLEGRHVILVDDSVDTGGTLRYVARVLSSRAPASFAVCALLDRPAKRTADISIRYVGFEIPDVYVVGYGLDFNGRYRELEALHAHGTWP